MLINNVNNEPYFKEFPLHL